MDELLREIEQELNDCKQTMKTFSTNISQTLSAYKIEEKELQQQRDKVYQSSVGPGFSFSKKDRFQLKDDDETAQLPLNYSLDVVKKAQPNVIISKSSRFPKEKQPIDTPLEPNFDFVKRKVQAAVISTDSKMDDISTQASMSVGPGYYDIQEEKNIKKQSDWGKEARFPKTKIDEALPINPNYDAIKTAVKVPKIAKPIQKNKQIMQKREIEEMNEKLAASMYRMRPLEYDQATKQRVKGVVIKAAYNDIQSHPKGSRMRRFLIQKLMYELQCVSPGPGSYQAPEQRDPCMVVFRSHSTERRIEPQAPTPGPDYYYSKDDLIKARAIQVVFGKEERIKKPKKEDLDMRSDLEVNIDLTKPNAPQPIRWDVKETKPRLVLEVEDVGPGQYDIEHRLVEQRAIGGKIDPLTEKNERIYNIDPTKGKDFNDYIDQLYPSLDGVKAAIQTFKYHQDTEVHPDHVPDKELFPEKHKFYDVNLDVVREQLVKDIALAGKKGRGLQEWLDYVDDMKKFKRYMEIENKMPQLGEYDIKYDQIDKDTKVPNFDRYLEVDHEPIVKPETLDGDNLILNADKQKKHIQTIDFSKQPEARPTGPEPKDQELILNVNYNQVDPKVKNVADFERQVERPEGPQPKEQELVLDVNYKQVEQRVKGDHQFEKQQERDEDVRYKHKVDDNQLLLEPNIPQNTRTAVQMNSKTKRFVQKAKKNEDEQQPAPINVSRMDKAQKAIKPNVPRVRIGSKSNIKK